MSWQAYVDTTLVGSSNVDKASIISVAGDSVWATSAGFTLTAEEMKKISTILSGDEAAQSGAYSNGFYVAGERFVVTKVDDRSLYGRHGQEGVCIAKSKQAIVVGHHNKNQQVGNCAKVVENLVDYLCTSGY
ncbi:hypothetical protein TD95_002482 [Thielaviopsis punctulata]|uniref:Profilin n=1 Tax=Thielaviopsis punctulata TaxID=72032 RepID=A0A0F4ZEI7_9PEZI|nr:hypothetical protein TD95_002482 [Thielaviopsis punctulata]